MSTSACTKCAHNVPRLAVVERRYSNLLKEYKELLRDIEGAQSVGPHEHKNDHEPENEPKCATETNSLGATPQCNNGCSVLLDNLRQMYQKVKDENDTLQLSKQSTKAEAVPPANTTVPSDFVSPPKCTSGCSVLLTNLRQMYKTVKDENDALWLSKPASKVDADAAKKTVTEAVAKAVAASKKKMKRKHKQQISELEGQIQTQIRNNRTNIANYNELCTGLRVRLGCVSTPESEGGLFSTVAYTTKLLQARADNTRNQHELISPTDNVTPDIDDDHATPAVLLAQLSVLQRRLEFVDALVERVCCPQPTHSVRDDLGDFKQSGNETALKQHELNSLQTQIANAHGNTELDLANSTDGWDKDLLSHPDQCPESFECGVCMQIMKDAVRCDNEHAYCAGCRERAGACPTCRTHGVKPFLFVRQSIDKLLTKCPNEHCTHVCQIEVMNAHYETCENKIPLDLRHRVNVLKFEILQDEYRLMESNCRVLEFSLQTSQQRLNNANRRLQARKQKHASNTKQARGGGRTESTEQSHQKGLFSDTKGGSIHSNRSTTRNTLPPGISFLDSSDDFTSLASASTSTTTTTTTTGTASSTHRLFVDLFADDDDDEDDQDNAPGTASISANTTPSPNANTDDVDDDVDSDDDDTIHYGLF
eukprot:m.209089 g.209089  ORF g.209089 m.209089 type:complete len:650 (+) comp33028_c3_seq7:292-2241(+)